LYEQKQKAKPDPIIIINYFIYSLSNRLNQGVY